jgi:cell division protein FtsL
MGDHNKHSNLDNPLVVVRFIERTGVRAKKSLKRLSTMGLLLIVALIFSVGLNIYMSHQLRKAASGSYQPPYNTVNTQYEVQRLISTGDINGAQSLLEKSLQQVHSAQEEAEITLLMAQLLCWPKKPTVFSRRPTPMRLLARWPSY